MDKVLPRERATNAAGPLPGLPDLTLDECLQSGVWMINTGSIDSWLQVSGCLIGATPDIGKMVEADHLRLVRHGPATGYLLFDVKNTPALPSGWEGTVTDISHGQCELNLKGQNALLFLADYISVDLGSDLFRKSRIVRARIGNFKILLWWSRASDAHILVDRSFAQAFYDYLCALAARWSINQTGRGSNG